MVKLTILLLQEKKVERLLHFLEEPRALSDKDLAFQACFIVARSLLDNCLISLFLLAEFELFFRQQRRKQSRPRAKQLQRRTRSQRRQMRHQRLLQKEKRPQPHKRRHRLVTSARHLPKRRSLQRLARMLPIAHPDQTNS